MSEVSAVAGPTDGCNIHPSTVVERLADLSTSLDLRDVATSLTRVCAAAVATIEGAEYAGIIRAEPAHLAGFAASDSLAERIDRLQCDTGEGPSIAAIHDQHTVRIADLASEQRWPRFTPQASADGVRAVLAIRMSVGKRGWGALTLYSTKPAVFRPQDEITGLLLATYAAIAAADVQQQEHLRAGLVSRDLIGQAKGVLMERYQVDERRAFALLVRLSQDNNRRLIDIADRVVRTREDPTEAVAHLPRRD